MKLHLLAAGTATLLLVAAPVLAQTSAATAPALAPDAAAALDRMGAYLRQLKTFEVRSDATTEDVYENGQKLQFLARTTYLVQGPDKMQVDLQSDTGHRKIYYDGKTMSLVGVKVKKYVKFAVSGTVAAVLTRAADDYGIEFPLRDLFLWGSETSNVVPPTSGFLVGPAMIGDTPVQQYAFRQPGVDFQIWLTPGDKPLPRKMVITNTEVPQQPQYVAYFTWNTAPAVKPADFSFTPGVDYTLVDFGTAAEAAAATK